MATEYEGVNLLALADALESVAAAHYADLGQSLLNDLAYGALAKLQADGRLITGEPIVEYGDHMQCHGGPSEAIISHGSGERASWWGGKYKRICGPWLPVSDIGNDRGDNDG